MVLVAEHGIVVIPEIDTEPTQHVEFLVRLIEPVFIVVPFPKVTEGVLNVILLTVPVIFPIVSVKLV